MQSPTAPPAQNPTTPADEFDLNVEVVEQGDPASLVNVTNDNCGSTCGACVTG
jgi:FxLD family lantipeptide